MQVDNDIASGEPFITCCCHALSDARIQCEVRKRACSHDMQDCIALPFYACSIAGNFGGDVSIVIITKALWGLTA